MDALFDIGPAPQPEYQKRRRSRWSRTQYHGRDRCDLCVRELHEVWGDGKTPYVPPAAAKLRWREGDEETLVCERHDTVMERKRRSEAA